MRTERRSGSLSKRMQFGLAVLTFLFLMLLVDILFRPQGVTVTQWSMMHEGQTVERTIPVNIGIPRSGLYVFTAVLQDPLRDTLVIPRVNGYAMRVTLNDSEVGSVGDFKNPTANIWNHSHLFRIPRDLVKEMNTLTIELYGLHDVGLPFAPFFEDYRIAAHLVDMQNLYTDGSASLIIGATITLVILLSLLASASTVWRRTFLYFAGANLFFMFYNFDYTYRLFSGSTGFYLWMQKGIVISIYLATLFLILGMQQLAGKKRLPLPFLILFAISFLLFLFARDFVMLRSVYNILNLLLLSSFVYMLCLDLGNVKGHLYFADLLLTMTVIHTIMITVLRVQSVFMLQIGVFAMIVGQSLTLVMHLAKLEREKDKLTLQVMLDPLTGVKNRMWMQHLTLTEEDCILFLDVNSFKQINDTLGHVKGDEILVRVATVLTNHTRTKDEVIRYGGDEFIVVFRDTDEVSARRRTAQIASVLAHGAEPVSLSWGIVRHTGDLADDISTADLRMYEMKRNTRTNPTERKR